jgi:hypothetical protein
MVHGIPAVGHLKADAKWFTMFFLRKLDITMKKWD